MKLASVLKNSCVSLVLMCGLLFVLAGCKDKEEKPLSNIVATSQPNVLPSSGIVTPQPSPSSASNSKASQDDKIGIPSIAMKDNCIACHAINKKIVGPTWMSVSVKYKGVTKFEYNGKEFPLVEGLMMKVSLGCTSYAPHGFERY